MHLLNIGGLTPHFHPNFNSIQKVNFYDIYSDDFAIVKENAKPNQQSEEFENGPWLHGPNCLKPC